MRKTRHVLCKVLAWLDTELDISSWKLVCMDRKRCLGFPKMSSIFQIRGICCSLLEYSFYSKLWEQDFSPFSLHLFYGYAVCNLAIQATETNKCDLMFVVGNMRSI